MDEVVILTRFLSYDCIVARQWAEEVVFVYSLYYLSHLHLPANRLSITEIIFSDKHQSIKNIAIIIKCER